MSHQVLNSSARALRKRPTVLQPRFGNLVSRGRAVNNTTIAPDQKPSSTPPRLPLIPKFFSPSRPLARLPQRWPTTPETAILRLLLLRQNSPSDAIYSAYLRLMHDPLHTPLPQTMHQLVLRRVVVPVSEIWLPNFSLQPDQFVARQEARLREVIFQMRAEGFEPSIADYHFVLEQMAAMGHQRAAYHVYLEVAKSEHKPTERTIALVLLALVRRHKMKIYEDHMGAFKAEFNGIADRLLGDLLGLQQSLTTKPISPMCLDLACRVFKIAGRLDKFLSILKTGYGVDISQPDHLPIEFVERVQAMEAKAASPGGEPPASLPQVPRFTTHTLNTTLDILGRSGKALEMLSAFEVLTNPLPPSARRDRYQYDTWEDDEPESSSQSPAPARNWLANYVPSAAPNTASLGFMIKHTVDSFKFDLCKHYLLLAIHLDRVSNYNLRQQLRAVLRARREYEAVRILETKSSIPLPNDTPTQFPPHIDPPIDIPRVAVSHQMFTKVWGLANQKAHMRSLRGLVRTVLRVIYRKRKDIEVYKAVLRVVPSLGAPISTRSQRDFDFEDTQDGEIPAWVREAVKERPPARRQFSLASHVKMLEAETEKLESFLQHGIRGVEHSSVRIQAEMDRKEKRKAEAARLADELVADSARRKKEKLNEQKPGETPVEPSLFSPVI
ncbi:transcriptional regulatory protein [Ceratobasidium theobromae]|uniref:Transcriptional regulatory protein n=1 Tax=Ceratobasidium theobromae TaxID=1582974 RepID=A0A5N5QPL0_9AGAM|nr:transcriptional regulatory protein [Ceratobasidium theobromae]